jgi:hypothetical protein
VSSADFTDSAFVEAYGENFEVQIAETSDGVFGRCRGLWNEARATTRQGMIVALRQGMEPMLQRLWAIGEAVEAPGLFHHPLKHLPPVDLLKLLFCRDRDAAMEARTIIESRASEHDWLPPLLLILNDERHPLRRSAQWCVLDMFEDLPAFARTPEASDQAVEAIRSLMWEAADDYCRTIYKAGVVLGGHICTDAAASALMALVEAPSRVARRSAMHAVFHLAEWRPEFTDQIVAALERASAHDSEPLLSAFSKQMASDIAGKSSDHVPEPVFPEEAA